MPAHRTLISFHIAPYEGYILAFSSLMKKLLSQVQHSLFGLSDNQQSAGIFINAMHQPRTVTAVVRQVLKVIDQRINKGTAVVAVSRVYYHPRRLVYHQQTIVFIHYLQRYIFGYQQILVRWMRKIHLHLIVSFHAMIRFHRLTVYEYISLFSRLLHLIASSVFHEVHQKLIHAQRFLTFPRLKRVMLIHRRTPLFV